MQIDDSAGRVLKEFEPPPRRHVHVNPTYRAAILEGMHEAAQSAGGTSYAVFGGFPIPVAGKTGTAERPPHPEQSWYIVMSPYPNPRIVTAVTIEEGGFGAESAAPAALKILEAYYGKHTDRPRRPQRGEPGLMYATRARQARPEPFVARPGIAERLGLPYMDPLLTLSAIASGRLQRLRAGPGDPAGRSRQPPLLRRPAGDLRRARHRSGCWR